MASNAKEVKVKVATEEELSGVEALELRIDRLQKQKIQIAIDIAKEKLKDTQAEIEKLKQQKIEIKAKAEQLKEVQSRIKTLDEVIKSAHNYNVNVSPVQLNQLKQELYALEQEKIDLEANVDTSKLSEIDMKIMQLDQKSLDLQMTVETGELQKAKMEAEDLDGTTIDVDVNNIKAMKAVDQIGQGFDRLKQGATEVGEQFGVLLDKAGEAEQNKAFLEIGFNKAGSKQAEKDAIDAQKRIQDIVAKAPGDDIAMNSILSSAVAKDVKLMDKDMQGFADSVSDYFAGAERNGKHAAEAIQDVRSYITSGNVAELETTGIFDQSQLDQLKDIDDVGERVAKFQEMVNQSSYAGLGTADTLKNKWAEFGGMMDKSRTQLGGFFTDATKGTLDWIINLNDATGGLAGMGLALVQMASPLTDVVMGLGQMATGFKSLKEIGDFTGITGKLKGLKDALTGVGGKAKEALVHMGNLGKSLGSTVLTNVKNAATTFLNLGKQVWSAGLNALKSAGLWVIHKAKMAASTIATWASTAAQTALNFVMNMNPIMLVVMAIVALIAVLGYLYFNNEQVRAAVDGLGQSLMMFGQWIYNGAIYWLQQLQTTLMNLWNYIVTLGGLLPSNVQMTGNQILDTILRVLLFIATLPLQIGRILIDTIAKVLGFKGSFTQAAWSVATNAVSKFTNAINGIGQAVQNCLDWAYNIFMSHPIVQAAVWLGKAIANGFSALGLGQNSPGKIYKAIKNELGWTKGEIEGSDLPSSSARLGSRIVDSFGEPSLGLRYEDTMNHQLETNANGNTGNTGNTYNFYHYGDIDDEERMNKVLDALVRRLNFENETAGRTV